MRLVFRRARGSRTLLLAAVAATLIATSFVVGLLAYSRDVVTAAAHSTIASAPPSLRSLLVRASGGTDGAALAAKDSAVRTVLRDGIGDRPVAVSSAGYSVGRQLVGPVGSATGDADGIVYATVMFLDDLPDHADLVGGAWAKPGAGEVNLARAAAGVLDLSVGDRIPLRDRRTDVVTEVVVAGVFAPHDLADPYWLLVPGVSVGAVAGTTSYGPITLPREDFLRSTPDGPNWAADASAGWIVRPDLTGVGLRELRDLQRDIGPVRDALATASGARGVGGVVTELDQLVDRLGRADLVGRSALLTPVLLIGVLGGYALLLIAMLLTEQRRGETALMRARGAARPQIAGLAVREAALVVAPAALLGPPLAVAGLMMAADRFGPAEIVLDPRLGSWTWAIAAACALVSVAAMVGPSVRRSGTYVEELSTRSRPGRYAFAQRAGLDLALVALAVLAWFQLRQYASPLSGADGRLGIDPILVAAPTIGVLAGAVVSLRVLPRLTGGAERYVDRRPWPATMFGLWQAGRRPHAGPVLLLSLAIAVSTLAWSMLGTAQRSLAEQADFAVGADLRVSEANGPGPADRTDALRAMPGVGTVAPVARASVRLGPDDVPTEVVAIEPALASDVVRYRSDLAPATLFADLARARGAMPMVTLPAGARRIAAEVAASVTGPEDGDTDLAATLVLLASDGRIIRVPMGTARADAGPTHIEAELPAAAALSIVRIDVRVIGAAATAYRWHIADPRADGAPVELGSAGEWRLVDTAGHELGMATRDGAGMTADRSAPVGVPGGFSGIAPARSAEFALVPAATAGPAPAAATPAALSALQAGVGDYVPVELGGEQVTVHIVTTVAAVPGTTASPAAILADLSTVELAVARLRPAGLPVAEHWLATSPDAGTAAADAARSLPGVTVLDRVERAGTAGREPYGIGGRAALFAAGVGALVLALIGIAVDLRATARRRVGEFAVLQTMGAGSRLLARAVLAEQAFLAGLGVVVGLLVGVGVAATMAPLVILTPAAGRPEPPALLSVPLAPVLATAGGLFLAVMVLSAVVAATMGRRLAVARLRIGDE